MDNLFYGLLTIMLLVISCIDFKEKIISNELLSITFICSLAYLSCTNNINSENVIGSITGIGFYF